MEVFPQQTGLVMHSNIQLIRRIRKPTTANTVPKPSPWPVTSIALGFLSVTAVAALHQCNLPILAAVPLMPLLGCVAWAERVEYRRARAHYDGWHSEMAQLMGPRPAPRAAARWEAAFAQTKRVRS